MLRQIVSVLVLSTAACVTIGPVTPADDGFRAKLAASCSTADECDKLVQEARARYQHCLDTNPVQNCMAQADDRNEAERDLNRVIQADVAAKQKQAREDRQNQMQALNTWVVSLHALTDSCDDFKKADEMLAAAPNQGLIDTYGKEIAGKKRSAVSMRKMEIDRQMRVASKPLRDLDDLSEPKQAIVNVRQLVTDLSCYDAEAAATASTNVEAWAAKRNNEITAEESCRASTECMDVRAAQAICQTIDDRRQAGKDMAREKQNPSGYVNMTALHDLGSQIQDDDEKLPQMKKEFAASQHHPFNERLCQQKARCTYPPGFAKSGIKNPVVNSDECGPNGSCLPTGFCK
jgi:hypothetical protein